MQTATMRDLRYDFHKVEAWLELGEQVVITRHSVPVARIVKEPSSPKRKTSFPDYAIRAKEIFGETVLPNPILEERGQAKW